MSIFKKFAASIMVTVLLTTGAVGMTASANNYTDKPINNYIVSSSNKFTPAESKMDDTSATVKITSVTSSGATMTVRVYNRDKVDRTAGTAKIVGVSSYYTYLPNYVNEYYEKNHRDADLYARLGFTRASGSSFFRTSGWWSPDSI